ncbi:MAG: hypothetical protein Q9169_002722 [Polycauliona sp. 2 TL-2023]
MHIPSTFSLLWLLGLCAALIPNAHRTRESAERETKPKSWISTTACRWLNCCEDPRQREQVKHEEALQTQRCHATKSDLLPSTEKADGTDPNREIPDYVLEYAPLVHLHSSEKFWPCDIAEHLQHVTPYLNYTAMAPTSSNFNLTNLDQLNEFERGRFVYLTSDDNVEARPDWLGGEKNIPETPQELYEPITRHNVPQRPLGASHPAQIRGGRSDAPAVLVVVHKGNGIVDAFWFFFYSYNLGNLVFNIRFGNHVGDWEHTLVRFINGVPKYVFVSEHFFGQAYTYNAVEKIGKRPVVYSAIGTHAMYATPGTHPYILPLGLLHDETDRGPLWDPALNALTYTYNHTSDTLLPSNLHPMAPTEWFYFNGHWGDKVYPIGDSRQYEFVGEYHYVTGPLGPRWKHLGREKVCQGRTSDPCAIHEWLPPERVRVGVRVGEGEEEDWKGEEEDWKGDERDPNVDMR